jgi:hypothetical protein
LKTVRRVFKGENSESDLVMEVKSSDQVVAITSESLLNRARYFLVGYLLHARVFVNIDMGPTQLDVANIDTVMTQPFRVLSLVYKSYHSPHQCKRYAASFISLHSTGLG